ncbi:hypothetical protein C8R43DRAFT_942557 [Mycena crocata]|nr:hypothetical protein C8R43DRAFT_942557 [Mycena crocata]
MPGPALAYEPDHYSPADTADVALQMARPEGTPHVRSIRYQSNAVFFESSPTTRVPPRNSVGSISYWKMVPLRLAILAAQALVVIQIWATYYLRCNGGGGGGRDLCHAYYAIVFLNPHLVGIETSARQGQIRGGYVDGHAFGTLPWSWTPGNLLRRARAPGNILRRVGTLSNYAFDAPPLFIESRSSNSTYCSGKCDQKQLRWGWPERGQWKGKQMSIWMKLSYAVTGLWMPPGQTTPYTTIMQTGQCKLVEASTAGTKKKRIPARKLRIEIRKLFRKLLDQRKTLSSRHAQNTLQAVRK